MVIKDSVPRKRESKFVPSIAQRRFVLSTVPRNTVPSTRSAVVVLSSVRKRSVRNGVVKPSRSVTRRRSVMVMVAQTHTVNHNASTFVIVKSLATRRSVTDTFLLNIVRRRNTLRSVSDSDLEDSVASIRRKDIVRDIEKLRSVADGVRRSFV